MSDNIITSSQAESFKSPPPGDQTSKPWLFLHQDGDLNNALFVYGESSKEVNKAIKDKKTIIVSDEIVERIGTFFQENPDLQRSVIAILKNPEGRKDLVHCLSQLKENAAARDCLKSIMTHRDLPEFMSSFLAFQKRGLDSQANQLGALQLDGGHLIKRDNDCIEPFCTHHCVPNKEGGQDCSDQIHWGPTMAVNGAIIGLAALAIGYIFRKSIGNCISNCVGDCMESVSDAIGSCVGSISEGIDDCMGGIKKQFQRRENRSQRQETVNDTRPERYELENIVTDNNRKTSGKNYQLQESNKTSEPLGPNNDRYGNGSSSSRVPNDGQVLNNFNQQLEIEQPD